MKTRFIGIAISCFLSLSAQAQIVQNALSFDGTNDYVDCGNNASVQITGNQITLEAWIFPTSWKSLIWQGNIIAKEQNGFGNDNGYMLRAGNNGSLNLTLGSGSWSELISATNTLSLNTWQHVAGTYDGSYLRLYVNGNVVDSMAANINISNSSSTLFIGDNGSGARHFPGTVDEVRIWNIARTRSEIQARMNDELCGNETGLVLNYKMNQGLAGGTNAITTLLDDTGVNNGTLYNFTLSGTSSNFVVGRNLMASTSITNISDTICNGAVYVLGSQNITSAGTYTEIFPAANGCDSTVNLNLATAPAINVLVNANKPDSMYTINQNPGVTYQWYDCATGQHFPGATLSYFQPTYTGTFAVIISEYGCSDTSFCIAGNNGSGVGLASLAFTTVDVYPQPAGNELKIDLPNALGIMELAVYNLQGQLIYQKSLFSGTQLQLNCTAWKSGLYILRLTSDEKSIEKKLLIQH
tara:strand:+ start:63397 stop:64800 length:1404 start_codon:yes stop_codon:yes gene_type:complete